MAHAAEVSELVDGLIHSITGVKKNGSNARHLKGFAARGLRDQSYARTNQFDVKSKLDGLVEKFAVLNREDLSDALQERLEELPPREKWLPENLSLLLILSDRPVEKTNLSVLKNLRPETPAEELLTWDEIVANDPLNETGLWEDVERGYHSSGDERPSDGDAGSERSGSTRATSVSEYDIAALARLHLIQPGATELTAIESTQIDFSTSPSNDNLSLPSLTILRETLAMLRGWSSNLYNIDESSGGVSIAFSTQATGASLRALRDVLDSFTKQGAALQSLRRWIGTPQSQPWQRACQASVAKLLNQYTGRLARLEEAYAGPEANTVVSIVHVLDETRALSRCLVRTAAIVSEAEKLTSASPFVLLDGLYTEACAARMAGDDEALLVVSEVLCSSVQTYLRDISAWIASGATFSSNKQSLVVEPDAQCALGNLWHARYALRLLGDGNPCIPSFLAHKADTIFALGKARMFLTHLSTSDQDSAEQLSTGPDFVTLQSHVQEDPLMPFEDLFDDALSTWIERLDTDCAPSLKQVLLHDHGLLETITAISHLYLCAGNAQLETFALSLFKRLDRGSSSSPDSFLLTELARSTLGTLPSVRASSLSITFPSAASKNTTITSSLQKLQLHYLLPSPLQNITREPTSRFHSHAFTFLLQVHRAHYILRKQLFALRRLPSASRSGQLSSLVRLRQALLSFTAVLYAHIATAGRVLASELRVQMISARGVDAMVQVYAAHTNRLQSVLLLSPNLEPIRAAVTGVLELGERFSIIWEAATAVENTDNVRSETARRMQQDFTTSLAFITAGVRGVSRAGRGEVLLEALAERLEWMALSP